MADPTAAPNFLDALAGLVSRVTAPAPGPASWKPPTPPPVIGQPSPEAALSGAPAAAWKPPIPPAVAPEPEPASGTVGARIGRGYPVSIGEG